VISTEARDLPVPAGVTIPFEGCYPQKSIEFLEQALKEKKTVIYGGLSILGNEGYMARVVAIFKPGLIIPSGWGYIDGGPPGTPQGLFRVNLLSLRSWPLLSPNYMVYVAGEARSSMSDRFTPKEDLHNIISWALSHIHD